MNSIRNSREYSPVRAVPDSVIRWPTKQQLDHPANRCEIFSCQIRIGKDYVAISMHTQSEVTG